jgi:hypothetical protein
LGALFRPQRPTRPLLRILLAGTGHGRSGQGRGPAGRVLAVLGALVIGFPLAAVLGALPGAGLVWGVLTTDWWLVAAAAVLIGVGFVLAMVLRLGWMLTQTVPRT